MKQYLYKLWERYQVYQERRAAYEVLSTLTDYQLKDIGIGSRSDIRRMICEYQKK